VLGAKNYSPPRILTKLTILNVKVPVLGQLAYPRCSTWLMSSAQGASPLTVSAPPPGSVRPPTPLDEQRAMAGRNWCRSRRSRCFRISCTRPGLAGKGSPPEDDRESERGSSPVDRRSGMITRRARDPRIQPRDVTGRLGQPGEVDPVGRREPDPAGQPLFQLLAGVCTPGAGVGSSPFAAAGQATALGASSGRCHERVPTGHRVRAVHRN
jgi:hypothetical protein